MTALDAVPDAVPDSGPGAAARRAGPGAAVRAWGWGWLAVAHLTVDLVLAVPYLVIVSLLVAGVATIPAVLVGVPMTAIVLAVAYFAGFVERHRVGALTGAAIRPPTPPPAHHPRWRRLLLDSRPWRASLYLLLEGLWGLVAGGCIVALAGVAWALAALPTYAHALPDDRLALPLDRFLDGSATPWLTAVGVLALVILPLLARGLVTVDISLARWLLGPSGQEQVERLSARVQTLSETRAAAIDSVEAERRRIERDLHDGPQQRLVAIAMDVGMARERLTTDPDGARDLLDKAHVAAKEAMTEMRHVARGIAPPVLTDRGLDAALSALAVRSPVPVEVTVHLERRPTPTVEAIAYFCVSEALTNVAKHARASRARVEVTGRDGVLTVRVADDGRGGADGSDAAGTGLQGLRDRVRAVDGSLAVSSPPGGPTVLTATLPDRPRAAEPHAPWSPA